MTSDVFIHLVEKVYPDSILVDQDMSLMAVFGQGSQLLNREMTGVVTTLVNNMFNNKIGVPIMTALESVHREQKEHVYEGIELPDGSVRDLAINSFVTESGDIYVCNLVDSELEEPAPARAYPPRTASLKCCVRSSAPTNERLSKTSVTLR